VENYRNPNHDKYDLYLKEPSKYSGCFELHLVGANNFEQSVSKSGRSKDLQIIAKSLKIHKEIAHKKRNSTPLTPIPRKLYNVNDLSDIPEYLLKLDEFQSFQSCTILVHQKGLPIAQSSYSDRDGDRYSSRIDLAEFSTLFSSIKKSKNRSFTQEQLFKHKPRQLGILFARVSETKEYRFIMVFSRNDFIPFTNDEKQTFETVADSCFISLMVAFKYYAVDRRAHRFVTILNQLPFGISLLKEDRMIYSNDVVGQASPTAVKNLDSQFRLEVYGIDTSTADSNYLHERRVALLGELLNTLKHELSNPLFGLKLSSQLLVDEMEEGETKEFLSQITQSVDRCQSIIDGFSYLYKDSEQFEMIRVKDFINDVLTLTKTAIRSVEKKIVMQDDLTIFVNPTWLSQIIVNLLINAADAVSVVSKPTIELNVSSNKNMTCIINVIDNGNGISAQIMDKVFTPFFTTKELGTGLGLSISRNLTKKMGGDLIYKRENGRTHFIIHLPLRPL